MILALSTVAWYPIYKHQKKIVRAQARTYIAQGVPKSEQMCFKGLVLKQLDWVEKHEFVYNNQMYDVVVQDTINGEPVIYALLDTAETNLVSFYHQHNQDHQKKDLGIAFMFAPWCSLKVEMQYPKLLLNSILFNDGFQLLTCFEITRHYKIPTPPPEILKA